jgi:HSP20 family protein
MRLRYKLVTYHFGADQRSQQSIERHYRELVDELLRQGQHHALTQQAVQWRPATDIYETPDAILVKMELAGMREEDIEVTLYEDALVVAGRRADDAEMDNAIYYHEAQIRYGPFRAEIMLPGAVQREGVEAHFENGFLRLKLPKVPGYEREETRIEIKRGEMPDRQPPNMHAAGREGDHPSASPQTSAGSRTLFDSAGRGGLRDA